MSASIQQVRQIALALPGVTEGTSYGTTAFYAARKLMLRLRDDDETLVVRCPIELRDDRIENEPDIFFVTEHYRNYPAILVSLLNVKEARLREIIREAWVWLTSPGTSRPRSNKGSLGRRAIGAGTARPRVPLRHKPS